MEKENKDKIYSFGLAGRTSLASYAKRIKIKACQGLIPYPLGRTTLAQTIIDKNCGGEYHKFFIAGLKKALQKRLTRDKIL